jgi:mono/diheme cytochrome c family protein
MTLHELRLASFCSLILALSVGCSAGDVAAPAVTGNGDGGSSSSGATSSTGAGGGSGGSGAMNTAGGGVGGSGATRGAAGSAGSGAMDAATTDGSSLTVAQARGHYLTGVLGCVNCHTPKVNGMLDMANLFGGVDCIPDAMGNCLSPPNLTSDATGLRDVSDQKIIDAFRTGKDPMAPADAAAPAYLFANMPWFQFANLTDQDAQAIVAYLRSLKPVVHKIMDNTGIFATQPTSPQWTPADLAKLPAPGASAPGDAANGKYLATLLCVTCHTVNTSATAPLHVDETKAFQGGKSSTISTEGGMMIFQSGNLTPDMTGLKDWTAPQIVTAIQTSKDNKGKTLCSPMRANAAITTDDATAIADYLMSLTPVSNPVNACMARM